MKTGKVKAYCVKCKAEKPIADAVEQSLKNGRKALKGKCPTCGTSIFKMLPGKTAPATKAPSPAPSPSKPAFRLTFFHN